MNAIIKFLIWSAANTRLLYAFLIALLIHVTLIAALGWIKIGINRPRIVASFDAGVLPPPAADKSTQGPNTASRGFDYNGRRSAPVVARAAKVLVVFRRLAEARLNLSSAPCDAIRTNWS